jgi:NAD(P)-dependent dehydrogenase (short-subunit alcohol dehydrogenase family)
MSAGDTPLAGRIALVAGATRGAGRGIARELAAAGASVYCTGRSVRGAIATPGRTETIEETAELIAAAGGTAIAVQVDHSQPDQVEALIARIRSEQGRLDVLVNDIWGGDALTEFGKPFWQLDTEQGRVLLDRAVHTHIVTSRYAAPLMMETRGALIVGITDGDAFWYRGNLFYDLAKIAVIRLAFAQAYELRRHGVSAVALTPGFLRSEAVLEHFGVTEANWTDAIARDTHFAQSESPRYIGRAVAALAADSDIAEKSGRVFSSWALAREYGFTDANGSQPDWGAYFAAAFETEQLPCDDGFYRYWHGGPMYTAFGDWP